MIVGVIKGFEWMVLLTRRVTWRGEREFIPDMVIIHYEAVITSKRTPSLIRPQYFHRQLLQLSVFVPLNLPVIEIYSLTIFTLMED